MVAVWLGFAFNLTPQLKRQRRRHHPCRRCDFSCGTRVFPAIIVLHLRRYQTGRQQQPTITLHRKRPVFTEPTEGANVGACFRISGNSCFQIQPTGAIFQLVHSESIEQGFYRPTPFSAYQVCPSSSPAVLCGPRQLSNGPFPPNAHNVPRGTLSRTSCAWISGMPGAIAIASRRPLAIPTDRRTKRAVFAHVHADHWTLPSRSGTGRFSNRSKSSGVQQHGGFVAAKGCSNGMTGNAPSTSDHDVLHPVPLTVSCGNWGQRKPMGYTAESRAT